MPFGVNSDPSFRAQKRSIRVRVSSFRTAGTVVWTLFGSVWDRFEVRSGLGVSLWSVRNRFGVG